MYCQRFFNLNCGYARLFLINYLIRQWSNLHTAKKAQINIIKAGPQIVKPTSIFYLIKGNPFHAMNCTISISLWNQNKNLLSSLVYFHFHPHLYTRQAIVRWSPITSLHHCTYTLCKYLYIQISKEINMSTVLRILCVFLFLVPQFELEMICNYNGNWYDDIQRGMSINSTIWGSC